MKQVHVNKISDDELREAYADKQHIGKVAVHFNLPHITVWRRLRNLGVEVKTVKTGIPIPLKEILEGEHPYYQTFKLNKRLLADGVFENKCSICGIQEWNSLPISMQLDHINGCSYDHRLENLRFLCPNCHSQTDTWCGKNKKG
jgi:hypothetical protein